MLTCPHCLQSTKYSFADEFDRVDAGRFICGNCKKEFFALNNVAMTKKEFQANLKSLRGDHAYARVNLSSGIRTEWFKGFALGFLPVFTVTLLLLLIKN